MKLFSSSKNIGFFAMLVASVMVIGLVFITLFYTIREPFGTWNDICNAIGGILSSILAILIYPIQQSYSSRNSGLALLSACFGAIIAVIGSLLIIRGITDWFLAGLISTLGYALIGFWLFVLNNSMLTWNHSPIQLARFGRIVSIFMMIGFLVIPGIITRTDSMEMAQWFVLAGLVVGGIGWTMLYSIWCIWLGRLLLIKKFVL